MTAILSVEGISKKFCREPRAAVRHALRDIAREVTGRGTSERLRTGEFWSLRDVSFELARGDALAIIGANGAGKSTLLKIISGLLKPDAGRIRRSAELSELVDLGAGLNPMLTGRENLLLGAALQGLTGAAARRLVERALEFSELEHVMDAALQTYSTGMRARLAYALATQTEPDILLIDEALAVGDLPFQRKCMDHLRNHLDGGGALILVSHNPYQTQSICNRGLLLEQGQVVMQGSAIETVHRMLQATGEEATPIVDDGGPISIRGVRAEGPLGGAVRTNEPMRLTFSCEVREPLDMVWGFSIWSDDEWVCVSGAYDMRPRQLAPGLVELGCTVEQHRLLGGRYRIRPVIADSRTLHPIVHDQKLVPGATLTVETEPNLVRNGQMAHGQLVDVDVAWD